MSGLSRALVSFALMLPVAAPAQSFAKVEVKTAASAEPRERGLQVLPNGDLMARGTSVIGLLSYAYDVPANPSQRLIGLPDWVEGERYDIDAKAAGDLIPAHAADAEVQRRVKEAIRQMLGERFHLVMRSERKHMAVYALTAASDGAHLQVSPVTAKDCVLDSALQACHTFAVGFGHPLIAKAVSMDDLAHYIENWTDLPVVDRTRLEGLFTLDSEGWLPMRLPPPPPGAAANANVFAQLPTIFTVLAKLGLKLERGEQELPVYTVERIERPEMK